MTEREEEIELQKETARIGMECYNSFYFFFTTFWDCMSGDEYKDAPHIKYICDTIQKYALKVVNGEVSMRTLIINVPPGSSKSTIATIAFPMWVWLRAPWLASTNVSYSDTLSARHAKKSRAITDSKKWGILFDDIFRILHNKKFEITTQNKKAIENNFKGERFNTSVGGTITGMHADFIIKDDMQNPQTAKSDTERESANVWDEETLTSRHKNEMCYLDIIIAQRLHQSDLTGYTTNKDIDIVMVCLPSEMTKASKVQPKEAESIYTDGILDPVRRPKFVLDQLKAKSGSASYTCQYLQTPFNLEEQDVTPAMFEILDVAPDNLTWDIWIDGAYTENTANDPTGIDIISKHGNDIVTRDSFDVWLALPKLVSFVKEISSNDFFDINKSRIFIEPKASGYSLYQYLISDTELNCVLIGAHNKLEAKLIQEGKTARHNMIVPKAQSHRTKLVKGTWNDNFIVQICGFPRAAHDEHVDNLGYAINNYYHKESTFIEEWALNKLSNEMMGHVNILITSQEVTKVNGAKGMAVGYEMNDKGDVRLYDVPGNEKSNNRHNYRYISVVVMKSESERGGVTSILVFDRLTNTIAAMWDGDSINPRRVAKKALELSYLYDNARLVVVVKKTSGLAQNEELDISHTLLQEIRKYEYNNLHVRLTVNNMKKTREREYGFEVNRSSSREIYFNLKDRIETNNITSLPLEVFEDVSVIERKKEDGSIEGQEGREINRGLGLAVALKVSDEWSSKVSAKNKKSNKWL